MTRDDIIRMAREAANATRTPVPSEWNEPLLERFAELVAAAEREKHDIGMHTCSNRCQRYACVAVREAVQAEREACARVCEAQRDARIETHPARVEFSDNVMALQCAADIRARSKT